MGAWGAAIFSDDTAADVRDDYQKAIRDGPDAIAATDALIASWKDTIADPDEGPVFWLALALTQHKLGRLEERVKREALRAVDDGLGLDRWREAGAKGLKARLAVLARAKEQLLAPQPAARKIRPPFRDSCKWEVGELIDYRLNSGTHIVLRVVAHETHASGVGPVCELLDWTGTAVPQGESLDRCGIRRVTLSPWSLFQILARNAPEYASEPSTAMNRLLADMGLLDPAAARISLLGAFDSTKEPPPAGFDWNKHLRQVEAAIDKLRAGGPKIAQRLNEVARKHSPKLLDPVSQISLRREPGAETLPMKRLKRIAIKQPPSPPGDWLVVRWHELDEFLKDVFQLE